MYNRGDLVKIATKELGNGEPKGDDKYISWYGGFAMAVPWCAIFVSWVCNQAGIIGNGVPKFASCDLGMQWFKQQRQWQNAQAYGGTYIPQVDDIVFFSSSHNQSDSTHVGIVKSVEGNILHTIEGNYSDKVKERTIYLANNYILGYGTHHTSSNNDVESNMDLVGKGIGQAIALTAVNVRPEPNASAIPVCGVVKQYATVEVLEVLTNGWLKIAWISNTRGYAYVSNTKPYFTLCLDQQGTENVEDGLYVGTMLTTGMQVRYSGKVHYVSSTSTKGKPCTGGLAQITKVAPKGAKHLYHIEGQEKGCTVYGWVDANLCEACQQDGKVATGAVTASVLNMRTGSSAKCSKVVGCPQLRKGTLVSILDEVDGWYYVSVKGYVGYVSSNYVKLN